MVIEHLNHRFPDATKLEAFSMLDGRSLTLNEEELRVFGKESFDTISKNFQLIIYLSKVAKEWEIFKYMAASDETHFYLLRVRPTSVDDG